MEDYFKAKEKLFVDLNKNSTAIVNIDDDYGKRIFNSINSDKISYGFNPEADILIVDKELELNGTNFSIDIFGNLFRLKTNLIGDFNLLNIASCIGALIGLDYKPKSIVEKINKLIFKIPGRMERIYHDSKRSIYIDYAHTPDAYKNIFTSIKKINKGYKIIAVFGCGGERDEDKRSQMVEIAEIFCDKIIITSDNPRNENLDNIINHMIKGVKDKESYKIIKDRSEAIKVAIDSMSEKSILLILGKGRENYQIIDNKKVPFSDTLEVEKYFEN